MNSSDTPWMRCRPTLWPVDSVGDSAGSSGCTRASMPSVRIALIDRDVPSCFRSLEHLLRYCAQARGHGARDRQHRQEAAANGHGTGGCCDTNRETQKPRSHDTSRIAWAKLMARVGEEFPLECPACGGDIRLIAFITEPGPIRKILEAHESLISRKTVGEVPLTGLSSTRRSPSPAPASAGGRRTRHKKSAPTGRSRAGRR